MPVEELIELSAEVALRAVSEFPQLIFNRHVARYFHGIGRRVIVLATLGTIHIPSSLRVIPKGQARQPKRSDWIALCAGIVVWVGAFSGTLFFVFLA